VRFGWQLGFVRGAADQLKLRREQAVNGSVLLWFSDGAQALNQSRACPAITIIVQQGMLRGQATFALKKLGGPPRADQECLQQ